MSISNFFIFSLYQPIGYISSSQRLDDTTTFRTKIISGKISNDHLTTTSIHHASLPASRHAPRASQQRAAVATSAIRREEMTTLQREASTSEPSERRDANTASTRCSHISHQKRRDDNVSTSDSFNEERHQRRCDDNQPRREATRQHQKLQLHHCLLLLHLIQGFSAEPLALPLTSLIFFRSLIFE